ncbi:MAG: hypothetical protein QF632_04975 [Candidatus Woesearchaeota archaeon]|jgi:hypothetical protein|nr:hypothetical protein [Candidatus Woesearchaeota archaeon]MDP7457643.1 hypothetical protein [Candidatus Woesearchaeota archaeon]|tara:strand:- start:244 stop:426 length:183 start_codon:yes stop_codon:yes gene_type:complete
MAFIRTKTIKGRRYFYLVENKRVGKKVVQKVLRYLGSAESLAELALKSRKSKKMTTKNDR